MPGIDIRGEEPWKRLRGPHGPHAAEPLAGTGGKGDLEVNVAARRRRGQVLCERRTGTIPPSTGSLYDLASGRTVPTDRLWERGEVDSERTLIFEIVEESVTKEDEWTVRFEQWPPAEPGEPILELTLEIIGETPGEIGLRVGNRYAMKDVVPE